LRKAAEQRLDICLKRNGIPQMAWKVEYSDEFNSWWDSLTESELEDVGAYAQ
jgi:hypothetical protein